MKRSPFFVLAGTVAGFVGVLGLHSRAALPVASGTSTRPNPPAPTAGRTRAAPGSKASSPPAAGGVRGATGASVQFGYGQLSVRVTADGTRITSVTVASLQTLEPTSQQISDAAIPVLRSEVLAAQSASINGVSGATYTSQAYDQSLQSALDTLHL